MKNIPAFPLKILILPTLALFVFIAWQVKTSDHGHPGEVWVMEFDHDPWAKPSGITNTVIARTNGWVLAVSHNGVTNAWSPGSFGRVNGLRIK